MMNDEPVWSEVAEAEAAGVPVFDRTAGRCVRWDMGGCPAPSGRSCLADGGCCNWPQTPHVTAEELALMVSVGCMVAVDASQNRGSVVWEVLPGSRETFGEMVIPLRGKPLGKGVYLLRVGECGVVYYDFRQAGTMAQSGSGGVRSFAITQVAARQGAML